MDKGSEFARAFGNNELPIISLMSEKKYKPQLIARESAIKILYQMKMQDETLEIIMNGFIEKREYDASL